MLESGKLVHKIGFDIDNKSWQNFNKFQKRITQLKAQMQGLNGAINLKVNVSQFKQQAEKVAKIKADAEARVAKQSTPKMSQDVMGKRNQRIENLEARLRYQMNKAGVDQKAQKAFFDTGFSRQAGIFQQTGDISNFTSKVGLASRALIDQSRSAKTAARQMHDLRSTMIAATQAYTAFSALQNVAMTGMKIESMQAGMKLFAGGDAGIKAEMEYIEGVSKRLGLNFMEAAEQYNKFSIVSRNKLNVGDRKALFEGFSEFATVLQVTPERFQRSMMAIQQINGLPI